MLVGTYDVIDERTNHNNALMIAVMPAMGSMIASTDDAISFCDRGEVLAAKLGELAESTIVSELTATLYLVCVAPGVSICGEISN